MTIQEEGKFRFIEEGQGKPLVLLHGLFGALSNFSELIKYFKKDYRVIVPVLPLYELPLKKTGIPGMVDHVRDFVEYKGLEDVHLVGNSLGGHVGLIYAIRYPESTASLTLTGSSGLFENSLGNTFPKRSSYEYVKTKTETTFYDPMMATKELVDEVYDLVNDNYKLLRILAMARSAIRQNLADKIHVIDQPCLLIWGKNDIVTPPFVGEEFQNLLPNSELIFIDKCGHAPMMEVPEEFNAHLEKFLKSL